MDEKKYVCSLCGAEYDSPAARARCELECDEKAQQRREEERRKALEATKDARKAEIERLRNAYNAKLREYLRDYGSYSSVHRHVWEMPCDPCSIFDRWGLLGG